jgi:hypothetical protein
MVVSEGGLVKMSSQGGKKPVKWITVGGRRIPIEPPEAAWVERPAARTEKQKEINYLMDLYYATRNERDALKEELRRAKAAQVHEIKPVDSPSKE